MKFLHFNSILFVLINIIICNSGFLIGNYKIINLSVKDEKLITVTDKNIILNSDKAEIQGNYYDINSNKILINNIIITKVPPFKFLMKSMGNYKWIKYIQKNNIVCTHFDYKDNIIVFYECGNYSGKIILEKLI